mmetsp:Transcript_49968/g.75993  ORF Transcript_49968/g.75993 Transcript_49968/m.75993 type:complete len:85 (+) Transcript_49968:194-448(+)
MPHSERYEIVKACKWADEVVPEVDYDPTLEIMDKYNCSHCVHGDDIAVAATGLDSYHAIKTANRMITVKRTEGISTTDIIGRLL